MEQEKNEGNTNRQQQNLPPPPAGDDHPHHRCPRCSSSNTKFCYYNNYSLSQPRYFCRACRRYWTHGGTLRNVPIGGGCRRNRPRSRIRLLAAFSSGQMLRPLPPPEIMGNAVYSDVTFLPPFAAMQPAGQFGVNLSLLQAMSIQSLKPPGSANQFQAPGNLFPAQPNLINQPIRAWAQNFNITGSSSPGVGPSFMDKAGPSFSALNQGPGDNHPGFNPLQSPKTP